ncbi:hypothetical protein Ccrd_013597 [Cynara cardunculus var. scolymus]|uniref:Uncharacterized protein n=1 Tax=Cynara cardunculus var. scolymus TaxID=59895 RepID=A0A103YFA7_CYNCS|nr:hypothetical protein Ccrd_013597 [Cynara cardunculus var. scolymus]
MEYAMCLVGTFITDRLIHNVLASFINEMVGNALANYVGSFLMYDEKNKKMTNKPYMRVRTLKKEKKTEIVITSSTPNRRFSSVGDEQWLKDEDDSGTTTKTVVGNEPTHQATSKEYGANMITNVITASKDQSRPKLMEIGLEIIEERKTRRVTCRENIPEAISDDDAMVIVPDAANQEELHPSTYVFQMLVMKMMMRRILNLNFQMQGLVEIATLVDCDPDIADHGRISCTIG